MQKQIVAIGISLLSTLVPLEVFARNYNQIFVFGDSLSDTGNVFEATAEAIPPNPIYYNGRFVNGPVWVEYLSLDLSLPFNQTTNFAFGGATTGDNNIGLPNLPGLQQQITSFMATNLSANPDALYIIWAGTNDYLSYFLNTIPNPTETVANLSAAVTILAAVGAEDIMVVNLPDLGKFPVANFDENISSLFSTFIGEHNSALNTNLNFLREELSPNINLFSLDVYSLFERIFVAPEDFGFTNVSNACIGDDLSVVPIPIPPQSVICEPESFLFWDEVHLTTETNKLIGELALSVLQPPSIPESNLSLGILGFGIIGLFLKIPR